MGPVAKKVLEELRRGSGDVVELESMRAAARAAREESEMDEDLLGEMPQEMSEAQLDLMWVHALVTRLGFGLLGLSPVRALGQQIQDVQERAMPGAPMSPVTDSFFMTWAVADAAMGDGRECLARIVADLGANFGLAREHRDACLRLADSVSSFYEIVERDDMSARLRELITAREHEVLLVDDYAGDVGQVWWARVVPEEPEEVLFTTPYVFRRPEAAAQLTEYLSRALGDALGDERALRRLLEAGPSGEGWFDFIEDAFAGRDDLVIFLAGVPDRPDTLPRAHRPLDPEEADAPLNRLREALGRIGEERHHVPDAIEHFLVARQDLELPDLVPLEWTEVERSLLLAFAYFGVMDEDGKTAVDHFLAEETGRHGEAVDTMARALAEGWFSVFEVLHVQPGHSIRVKDRLRNRKLTIVERSGSLEMLPGSAVCGWVYLEGEDLRLEGSMGYAPPVLAPRFLRAVDELKRFSRNRNRRYGWRKRHGLLAPHVVSTLMAVHAAPPSPQLVTKEGDEVLLSTAHYRIADPGAVDRALARSEEATAAGPGQYHFGSEDSVLAGIEISDDRLKLFTHSRPRLLKARATLEKVLGSSVQHLADAFEDPTRKRSDSEISAAPVTAPKETPPEVEAAIAEMLEEHLDKWIDTEIPALGGRTPRRAVRSEEGRGDVTAILLAQESAMREQPGGDRIRFERIWEILGLEHPRSSRT